jgi:hypothetical protein
MRDFQCMALVAACNATLNGRDLGAFWPNAAIFKWTETIDFVVPRPDGRFQTLAPDPTAWFAWLNGPCKGLRLHTAPMNQSETLGPLEERTMAGFVGGGPRWLIEAVGDARSVLWEGFDRVGNREHPEKRLWRATYIQQTETAVQSHADADLAGAARELEGVLVKIAPFASEIGAENFAEVFMRAREWLNTPVPPERNLGVPLSDAADRLVAGAIGASVFGGMGSWNDMGAPPEKKARYDALSEELFLALQRAVIAAANSTFKA